MRLRAALAAAVALLLQGLMTSPAHADHVTRFQGPSSVDTGVIVGTVVVLALLGFGAFWAAAFLVRRCGGEEGACGGQRATEEEGR